MALNYGKDFFFNCTESTVMGFLRGFLRGVEPRGGVFSWGTLRIPFGKIGES